MRNHSVSSSWQGERGIPMVLKGDYRKSHKVKYLEKSTAILKSAKIGPGKEKWVVANPRNVQSK